MILEKLTLHNLGIYAGTNTFDFRSDRPVVLIGGLNGRGKTTFLEAVLLALYGRRSFVFAESRLPYANYLRRLTNTADGTREAYIELAFIVGQSSEKSRFTLRRAWSGDEKTKDYVQVYKNDTEEPFLSEHWAMYIEELLPSAISRFFFFDGEKVSKLAVESADEHTRSSIKMLLGIDVLDRLETDLKRVLDSKSKRQAGGGEDGSIAVMRREEGVLAAQLDTLAREIKEIDTQNSDYQSKIDALDAQFMSEGGRLQENKAGLEERKRLLKDEIRLVAEQQRELAAGELPLLLVMPLLGDILASASNEQSRKTEQLAAARIRQLLDAFLAQEPAAYRQMEGFVEFLKANTQADRDSGFLYNLSDSGLMQARMLSGSFFAKKRREAGGLRERCKRLSDELNEVENYLSVAEGARTDAGYAQVKVLSAARGANEERKTQLVAQAKEVSDQLHRLRGDLAALTEKSLSEQEHFDLSARVIKYTNLAVQLVQSYRSRLQENKVSALAETVTACYKRIADKKNLIARILIDVVTLEFSYYDAAGKIVDKNRLSAGEKQLMVIAMLWALALCSHAELPVIIDTPLARLDSAHRRRIITEYFPHASEQTIILSTDAEIDPASYALLKPSIGREYTLVYNDQNRSTSIVEGYFRGGDAK